MIKKFDNLRNSFKSSEECEQKLVIASSIASLDDTTACHLCKVTDPLLKAFENARMTKCFPVSKEAGTPKKRGKARDAGVTKELLLS